MPSEKLEDGGWPHPSRLPLGCGRRGHCVAPGHEGEVPSQVELQDFCNLGYAQGCSRLPQQRAWDAVRIAVVAAQANEGENGSRENQIQFRYVCERAHRPADHGTLEFDFGESQWVQRHPDRCVQRMAECFLEEYFSSRKKQDAARLAGSSHARPSSAIDQERTMNEL